jgi:hypothetical protein
MNEISNSANITELQCAFPKLTEANQQYVLGIAEGLKYAQKKLRENHEKRALLPKDSGQREE